VLFKSYTTVVLARVITESFLPCCKNSIISICIYSKAYDIPRDRHDTFYTPVWGSVSLNSRCRVLFGW